MAEKITFSELTARIAKGELKKNEIASYFELDAANSTTFRPRFRVNTEAVDVTGVEGAARRPCAGARCRTAGPAESLGAAGRNGGSGGRHPRGRRFMVFASARQDPDSRPPG